MLDSAAAQIDKTINDKLASVNLPTSLIIYVAPQCKFCPEAVRQLLPLPTLNSNIRLTLIDAMHFPELAEKDNIQMVTMILRCKKLPKKPWITLEMPKMPKMI
jgi:alkyl hydroperoxide reductase subunit AhpF